MKWASLLALFCLFVCIVRADDDSHCHIEFGPRNYDVLPGGVESPFSIPFGAEAPEMCPRGLVCSSSRNRSGKREEPAAGGVESTLLRQGVKGKALVIYEIHDHLEDADGRGTQNIFFFMKHAMRTLRSETMSRVKNGANYQLRFHDAIDFVFVRRAATEKGSGGHPESSRGIEECAQESSDMDEVSPLLNGGAIRFLTVAAQTDLCPACLRAKVLRFLDLNKKVPKSQKFPKPAIRKHNGGEEEDEAEAGAGSTTSSPHSFYKTVIFLSSAMRGPFHYAATATTSSKGSSNSTSPRTEGAHWVDHLALRGHESRPLYPMAIEKRGSETHLTVVNNNDDHHHGDVSSSRGEAPFMATDRAAWSTGELSVNYLLLVVTRSTTPLLFKVWARTCGSLAAQCVAKTKEGLQQLVDIHKVPIHFMREDYTLLKKMTTEQNKKKAEKTVHTDGDAVGEESSRAHQSTLVVSPFAPPRISDQMNPASFLVAMCQASSFARTTGAALHGSELHLGSSDYLYKKALNLGTAYVEATQPTTVKKSKAAASAGGLDGKEGHVDGAGEVPSSGEQEDDPVVANDALRNHKIIQIAKKCLVFKSDVGDNADETEDTAADVISEADQNGYGPVPKSLAGAVLGYWGDRTDNS